MYTIQERAPKPDTQPAYYEDWVLSSSNRDRSVETAPGEVRTTDFPQSKNSFGSLEWRIGPLAFKKSADETKVFLCYSRRFTRLLRKNLNKIK